MESFLPLDLLDSGARELGIELTAQQLDRMDRFAKLVIEANRKFNLTRITEPRQIVTEHYLDSLTCLAAMDAAPGSGLIDVGAGAGFPGVPIAISRPDLSVTLLDSAGKKARFLSQAAEQIGLRNVSAVHARAEDAARDPAHRERYDIALARALAEMRIVAELCLPLVRPGGHLIAQKSTGAQAEIDDARALVGQLGGHMDRITSVRIPHTDIVRLLAVITKTAPTPERFPRPYARIARKRTPSSD